MASQQKNIWVRMSLDSRIENAEHVVMIYTEEEFILF
jgi:hypothetical protein